MDIHKDIDRLLSMGFGYNHYPTSITYSKQIGHLSINVSCVYKYDSGYTLCLLSENCEIYLPFHINYDFVKKLSDHLQTQTGKINKNERLDFDSKCQWYCISESQYIAIKTSDNSVYIVDIDPELDDHCILSLNCDDDIWWERLIEIFSEMVEVEFKCIGDIKELRHSLCIENNENVDIITNIAKESLSNYLEILKFDPDKQKIILKQIVLTAIGLNNLNNNLKLIVRIFYSVFTDHREVADAILQAAINKTMLNDEAQI